MIKYIVELMGGQKIEVTEERGEILDGLVFPNDSLFKRPDFVKFFDIKGRKYSVRSEQITRIYDGRTDLDMMYAQAIKENKKEKENAGTG